MPPKNFLTGVIEGFYGRSWSTLARAHYADYLSEAGLNAYIYCPKSDPFLRRRWQECWPEGTWRDLSELSSVYRSRGIDWGIGLSPFALYLNYGAREKEELRRKVKQLSELSPSLIAILFDDMPGNLDSLANRQAEILDDVSNWLPGIQILVCPTYYSFDPVLERFFGTMPRGYWQQLGRELPPDVHIFWTGDFVCSEAITLANIQAIVDQLARPVTLWDNYPVNDGAVRSNFLFLDRLNARSNELRPYLSGHFCNPMNQAHLSLPALSGLAELYGGKGLDDAALSRILGDRTWEKLCQNKYEFMHAGLSGLGVDRRRHLAAEYAALPGEAAAEVAAWLRGEFAFDPTCLTD